jgi:transcription elongation factor Elf1
MKLQKKTSQYRRDFTGNYKCEFCDHVEKDVSGYDDAYFHQEVTPKMKCKNCGKSTKSEGGEVQNVQTKYPEGHQV